MHTPDTIKETLRPFYQDANALEAAVSLVNAVVATEQALLMESGPEVAAGAGRMLTDFAFGLMGNPFWQKHAGYLTPVFASAVMARMDSYQHGARRTTSQVDAVSHISARQALAEVAVAILFCEKGTQGVMSAGPELRNKMIDTFGNLEAKP